MDEQIPRSLAPFFQEYTLEKLDPERDWELVVERTLAWGNRLELRWLFARYGYARVANWVQRLGMSRLSHRQFTAWKTILEIPDSLVRATSRGIWQY